MACVTYRRLVEKYWRPDIGLIVGAILLSVFILGLNIITLKALREDTLRTAETNLRSQATVLAEQGDRSFRILDLALSAISGEIQRLGIDTDAVQRRLTGRDFHDSLSRTTHSLPHVDAIALVDSRGRLVNFSRSWPSPLIDVADRDYFLALKADAAPETFISAAVPSKASGVRTIYLARRLSSPAGDFMGVLVGAMEVEHFEHFFRSIAIDSASAIALVRSDGMLLIAYPRSDRVGTLVSSVVAKQAPPNVRTDSSAADDRIASTKTLATYPLAIVVSQTSDSALRNWRSLADYATSMALVRAFFVLLVAWAASRWWQRQRSLTQQLRLQNLRFDTALNNMSQGLCFFDGSQRLIVCNNRYLEMYGLDPKRVRKGITLREIVDLRFEAGTFPAMSTEEYIAWRNNIAIADTPSDTIVELKGGHVFEIHHRPMADGGWVATHEDITDHQQLNARLQQNLTLLGERTALLQAIIDNFPGGIGFFDRDLRVALCNDRAKTILDLPEHFFVDGPPLLEDLLRFNALRGEYGPGDTEEQVAAKLALAKDQTTYHFERMRPDGTVLDVRGMPIANGGFITTYMDITERHRSEVKIAHMARHDALTGLANRLLLNERLQDLKNQVSRAELVAVHLLDLDRFKSVNDTLGHPTGDRLLQLVAERLRPLVREDDIIARMGGDEFAIVQVSLGSPADAASLADRVIEAISRPYDIAGREVAIGTSIGIALSTCDGLGPDTLLRNADLALYEAKGAGGRGHCFFEPDMDVRIQARHAMEIDLRNALSAQEFELHYQPMVSVDTNDILGCEALIRWNHPARGLVSPGSFLPLAEETGLIIAIGEWTIREACATAARWPSTIRIAVNLSPAQFRHPGLPDLVFSALTASGLAPERLELEINEMALWEDMDAALDVLYRLRKLGVRIAMDDFGTGHSSLNYLQSFPFDRIKIDRSFVTDIAEGIGSLRIVRAIATLAQGLGMDTTVEGVENAEQLALVKSEGCTEMQGFLFSRAMPSEEVDRLIFSGRRVCFDSSTAA